MGIRIFEECDLERIEQGYVSVGDLTGLDRVKDRLLIEYLIPHLKEEFREKARRRYGLKELPEDKVSSDDQENETCRIYYMLREQVQRENDRDVLRKAALDEWISDPHIPYFAFSRLTGYRWPEIDKDADGYLTYECGLKSDMLREDIVDFCMEMMITSGRFACEAEEWLDELRSISDETLDEWASGDTERKVYHRLSLPDTMKALLRPADGGEVLSETELEQKIRGLADAYILLLYEDEHGTLPRREKFRVTDRFIREVYDVDKRISRKMIDDVATAAKAGLMTAKLWREDMTDEWISDIVWSESDDSPLHGWFLELARQNGIR